jgi:hypothetical protein
MVNSAHVPWEYHDNLRCPLVRWDLDFQHLVIYVNRDYYENTLLPVTLNITVAWGWFIFVNNTLMTGGILYKIMRSTCAVRSLRDEGVLELVYSPSGRYNNALRAVIESALVTWIGILIYEITSLAPKGHITTDLDAGYVMIQILPIFFGISQCLITAHVGLTREIRLPGTDYQLSRARGHTNRTSDPLADTSTTVFEAEVSGTKTVTEEFV